MGKFEVVVADLDGTLIETLSGKSFSQSTVLMVGDASGLEGQFSDSDKVFAERAGASYIDVGDLLRG